MLILSFNCSFLIQNSLKQGDALSPLLFNSTLEYAIGKLHENQVGLKSNGTHQLLAYVDYVSLVRGNMVTTKKRHELQLMIVRGLFWNYT
jgi:hypothetical protein